MVLSLMGGMNLNWYKLNDGKWHHIEYADGKWYFDGSEVLIKID